MLLVKCSTHFRLFCLEVTSLLIILTLIPLRRDGKFVATFKKFLVNPKPLSQSCKGMNQKVWHAFQYSVANKSLLLNVLQFIFRFIQKQSPRRLLKKRLWHKFFPVNFAKFPRTPFFYRTPLVAASVYCRKRNSSQYKLKFKWRKISCQIH